MAVNAGESEMALPFHCDESLSVFAALLCWVVEPKLPGRDRILAEEIRVLKELLGKRNHGSVKRPVLEK
jgi:hypothetical protein